MKKFRFILLSLIGIAILAGIVTATSCWEYGSENETECGADSGCTWKSDAWGSWCEELNCWSLWTQSECAETDVPNKECTWTSSGGWGWCEQTSCYSYQQTNATACLNNSLTLCLAIFICSSFFL